VTHKRFLVRTFIAFTALVTLGALLNVIVDPYGLFEVWRSPGFNDVKPMAGTRVRITKPYQLARAKPNTVVVGNSRPELGIDPTSECWASEDQPVFNAGVPGIGVYYQARMIQTAIESGAVKRFYWGLDFLDFVSTGQKDAGRWPPPSSVIDKRWPVTADGRETPDYAWQSLLDMRDATLSLNAVLDSVVTIMQQSDAFSSTRRADGFNPARDYIEIVNTEGQGVLFKQKNPEIIRTLSRGGLALYPPGENWSQDFESVRFVLQLADQAGVETTLFINPYHADYLTAIEVTGNWPLLEDWKRRLTILASASETATLWDFNAFDQYSSTPPPDNLARGKALEWYWEPAHYRKELGDLMVARMRDTPCSGFDSGFGSQLDPVNIEAHLMKLREQKTAYLEGSTERAAMLEALANEVSDEVAHP
jgi:hypothetical protein